MSPSLYQPDQKSLYIMLIYMWRSNLWVPESGCRQVSLLGTVDLHECGLPEIRMPRLLKALSHVSTVWRGFTVTWTCMNMHAVCFNRDVTWLYLSDTGLDLVRLILISNSGSAHFIGDVEKGQNFLNTLLDLARCVHGYTYVGTGHHSIFFAFPKLVRGPALRLDSWNTWGSVFSNGRNWVL